MRDIYERIEVRFDVDHGSINLMWKLLPGMKKDRSIGSDEYTPNNNILLQE
jgi:hypothetical protein